LFPFRKLIQDPIFKHTAKILNIKITVQYMHAKSPTIYCIRRQNCKTINLEVVSTLVNDVTGKPMGIISIGKPIRRNQRSSK